MFKYNRGDVVWAISYYADGTGVKTRPAIILKQHPTEKKYLIIECSTLKEKHYGQIGTIIKANHPEFSNLGFTESTFISHNNKAWISEHLLKPPPNCQPNPIGFCNFINSVDTPNDII
jgi:hypothetical protein